MGFGRTIFDYLLNIVIWVLELVMGALEKSHNERTLTERQAIEHGYGSDDEPYSYDD